MAFGVPVVARGGDGTEDDLIEDGVSGYQVETTAEMEARIRQLLDDAPLRSAMGTAAVASIRRFDLANMCDRFEEAVRFALGRRAT
jgi:glycosyltransferase involved in cell wall biosynthesis